MEHTRHSKDIGSHGQEQKTGKKIEKDLVVTTSVEKVGGSRASPK